MERWFSPTFFVSFRVTAPHAAACAQRTQFQRFLSLIGIILLSSQFFYTVSASNSPSSTATTNGDVINKYNSRRSVVDVVNSTSKLGVSYSNKVDDVEATFHGRHYRGARFPTSSYVRASLQRRHQQQDHQQHHHQHQRKKDVRNLRKLSSNFGCLANATMCLTVPGWTSASNASTCCSNGLCTDIQFDGLNCGACGNFCNFGYFCCSGVCIATATDPNNCGTCANVCQGGACAFGFCGYSTFDLVIN